MASNCGDSSFQSIIRDLMDPPVNITDFLAEANPSPYAKIIEQPRSRGLRFRYECEGPRAGSLLGMNSTSETRTCPRIQIMNYKGPAVVVVSCVTKDKPHRPHPHSLVGKDCKNGVCTVTVDENNCENMQVKFPQLGIQCAKKKDIEEALRVRENIRVDPFDTGFHHQSGSLDLTVVCLCFQVFLWDPDRQMFQTVLTPVVTEPIFDKKALSELVICRVSKHSAPCCGGQEMFILCEKINKDDIEIRFFEELDNGQLKWEGFADFSSSDVHKQVAIVFKIPAYKDQFITAPVSVMFQLRRPSDKETSDPKPFQYLALDLDPEGIRRKRQKVGLMSMTQFMEDPGFRSPPLPSTSSTLPTSNVFQNRTIRQPERKIIKTETAPLNNCIFTSTTSNPFSSFTISPPKKEEMTTNNNTFTGATATTNLSSGDYFFQSTFLQNSFNFMPETLPQQEVTINEIKNPEHIRFDQSYNQQNTDLEQNANDFQNVLDNMVAHFNENIEPNLMDINLTDMERLDDLLNIIELDTMPSNT